ncbi:MAG: hypothetical protein M5U34_22050 [Chloroflexi bacterium]|nr:hypothetical protein [Chloroflexota bacterium]
MSLLLGEEIVSIEEIELSMPISDRIFVPIIRKISDFIIRFTPQTTLERTTRQLELAGNPRNMSAAEFWALRLVATVLLGGLVFMMMTRNGRGGEQTSPLRTGWRRYWLYAALYVFALHD